MKITETGPLPAGVTLTNEGQRKGVTGPRDPNGDRLWPCTRSPSKPNRGDTAGHPDIHPDGEPGAVTVTSADHATFTVGRHWAASRSPPQPTPSRRPPSARQVPCPPGSPTSAGTGTLSGTPAATTGGTYPILLRVTNDVAPEVTQTFTLTVNQAPAITSADQVTFAVGEHRELRRHRGHPHLPGGHLRRDGGPAHRGRPRCDRHADGQPGSDSGGTY